MINTAKEVVLSTEALDRLKLMLAPAAQRIIILSHTNPDGVVPSVAVDGTRG